MTKKILFAVTISIFLISCISITAGPVVPTPWQIFVTATLAPTAVRWMPVTSTIPPETTTPIAAIAVPANCTNAAILLRDVTVPDDTQIKAGESFTKTWEFQNTGTCPWAGYTMKLSTGDAMSAPLTAPVADTIPNGTVQVSVDLTAPSADGAYIATFTLNDLAGNAIPIGSEKSFWVKILVGDVAPPQNMGVASVSARVDPGCAYTENAGYVSELIFLINRARAEANVHDLVVNEQLAQAAQGHSTDMACNNFLSHFGSDGSGWWVRASRAGYSSSSVAEILAIGTPQDAMNQWRADPGHWGFVLNAGNTQIGVGYAYSFQSDIGGYITVDFGS